MLLWKDLQTVRPQIQKLSANFEKMEEPEIKRFINALIDFSKTHLNAGLVAAFQDLAGARSLAAARDALFAGEMVNGSEGRPAEHIAERGHGAPDSVRRAKGFHFFRFLFEQVQYQSKRCFLSDSG